MRVCITVEQRFHRTPDGACWTNAQFPYRFWLRYIDAFSEVRVIARVRDVADVPADWLRVDGPSVSLAPLPHYLGPEQFLLKLPELHRSARAAVGPADAAILRVGSQLATIIAPHLRRRGQLYGVEVVADPFDSLGPGAIRHPLRPLFRWWAVRALRHQCAGASAAHYVTLAALQRRYPCGGPSWASTDAALAEEAFAAQPRRADSFHTPTRLITVVSLAQLYKGVDVLIDAVALCAQAGADLSLAVVGDGRYRPDLERRAARLGVADRVAFRGQKATAQAVRDELDAADMFVLASRADGLPRAMVEAMARGLPCVGSTVGGIPELLDANALAPTGDAAALARLIAAIAADRARMAAMAQRNLEKAQGYSERSAQTQHLAFLRHLRAATEQQHAHTRLPRITSSRP